MKIYRNTMKIYRNLPQHLLAIIIYRLQISLEEFEIYQLNYWYRPGLFEIIDYRHRFSSKRVVVPIAGHNTLQK